MINWVFYKCVTLIWPGLSLESKLHVEHYFTFSVCVCMLVSRTLTDLLKQQAGEVSSVENATASSPSGGRANGISARMLRSRSGEYWERACTYTHTHTGKFRITYNTLPVLLENLYVLKSVRVTNNKNIKHNFRRARQTASMQQLGFSSFCISFSICIMNSTICRVTHVMNSCNGSTDVFTRC